MELKRQNVEADFLERRDEHLDEADREHQVAGERTEVSSLDTQRAQSHLHPVAKDKRSGEQNANGNLKAQQLCQQIVLRGRAQAERVQSCE